VVTLSALAHPAALLGAGAFWLWFVGFAVATTVLVTRTGNPAGSAAGPRRACCWPWPSCPRAFPLSLLRAGLDVLGRA